MAGVKRCQQEATDYTDFTDECASVVRVIREIRGILRQLPAAEFVGGTGANT